MKSLIGTEWTLWTGTRATSTILTATTTTELTSVSFTVGARYTVFFIYFLNLKLFYASRNLQCIGDFGTLVSAVGTAATGTIRTTRHRYSGLVLKILHGLTLGAAITTAGRATGVTRYFRNVFDAHATGKQGYGQKEAYHQYGNSHQDPGNRF